MPGAGAGGGGGRSADGLSPLRQTDVGDILIAMNPFQPLPLYGREVSPRGPRRPAPAAPPVREKRAAGTAGTARPAFIRPHGARQRWASTGCPVAGPTRVLPPLPPAATAPAAARPPLPAPAGPSSRAGGPAGCYCRLPGQVAKLRSARVVPHQQRTRSALACPAGGCTRLCHGSVHKQPHCAPPQHPEWAAGPGSALHPCARG